MSIEQLLFFLLLVGIPLLERVIRAVRARREGTRAQRPAGTPAGTVPPPLPSPPVPVPDGAETAERRRTERPVPARSLPPVPPASRSAAHRPLPPGREPRVRLVRAPASAPAPSPARPVRPRPARRVIAGRDLREAVVLAAVLGPCRALDPHAGSPHG